MKRRKLLAHIRSESGSNVAQAAAVALLAAALIGIVLTLMPGLAGQVDRAFNCLTAAISGGAGCGSSAADAGAGGAFQQRTAQRPALPDSYPPTPGRRGLTPEERALAEYVFGPGALDLDAIQISTEGTFVQPRAYVIGNTINWPPSSQIDPATLAHELTHVYQYQKRGWAYLREAAGLQVEYELYKNWPSRIPNPFSNPYDYGGEEALRQGRAQGKRFSDFNVEQQGQIVEDYYQRVMQGQDTSAYDPYIQDARQGRLDRSEAPQPRGWSWRPPWSGYWPDSR
jgi:hypothetical protein